MNPTPQDRPRYNPFLMALSSLIVPALAYLVLRLYGRFFIFYTLAIVIVFFEVPLLLSLLLIFVLIDLFLQTKKINDGGNKLGIKNKALNIFGIIMIIFFGIVYIMVGTGAKNYLTSSPSGCQLLYPFDSLKAVACADQSENRAINKATEALRSKWLTDPTCEAYRDSRLTPMCYFKKAVETKNIAYCHDVAAYGPNMECVTYFALEMSQPTLCMEYGTHASQEKECTSAYQKKKINFYYTRCEEIYAGSGEVDPQCLQEFGSFLSSLKYKQ